MTSICMKCHELRINDRDKTGRIIYRLDDDAVVILEVFEKKSQATPKNVIDICKKRIISYDSC
jgi:phage-related protein